MEIMKRIRFFLLTLAVAMLASCGTMNTVPITGRKQNLLVNDEQVLSLSNQQYQEYMQKARLSADGVNTAMVRRVGQRLADAVVTYLNSNGMGGDVSQYKWEFNLVQDSNVNAFCMPGGKIVVYDGLLPVTRDEASLAIVLGHEIAHAVARHSAERLSNQVKQQYGSQILGTVLSGAGASTSLQQIGSTVFGLGSTLGSAAYSRKQESEATVSASSLPPWQATIRRWPFHFGSAWPRLPAVARPSSATIRVMPSVYPTFRSGCLRL